MDDAPKSRSQKKREMTELQELGRRLAEQPDAVLERLALPPALRNALLEARGMVKHEARRRHMQYIGRLMREVDPEPVRAVLDDLETGRRSAAREHHRVEDQRDRLVGGDDELLHQLAEAHPEQRQRLRQLVLSARREQAAGKPPKASRALFRLLRELPQRP